MGSFDWRDFRFQAALAIFRIYGVYQILMFCSYFGVRGYYVADYTSAGHGWTSLWMWFVLIMEFLSTFYSFMTIIVRMRQPWSQFADQADGPDLFKRRILEDEEAGPLIVQHQDEIAPAAAVDNYAEEASEVGGELPDEQKRIAIQHHRRRSSGASTVDSLDFKKPVRDAEEEKALAINERFPGYVIRVLIPCYKEPVDIVNKVVLAATKLHFDRDRLHVYLCDDGSDPKKEEWVKQLRKQGSKVYYVSRPQEHKGHAKAGNMNYTLKHVIYKDNVAPAEKELIAVFDADMISFPEFLERVVPYFEENPNVVLVQTPQAFHNVPSDADFFDCQNKIFFNYTIPGLDAWNAVSCCGTNFMVSAKALYDVGFMPTSSVTEDAYLSMRLYENGGRIRYHAEILAIGEAPEDLRQIFQQRSRWCKGSLQIALQNKTLTNPKLTWIQRYWFFGLAWNYISSGVFNLIYTLIVVCSLLFGLYPVPPLQAWSSLIFGLYFFGTSLYSFVNPSPIVQHLNMWYPGKGSYFFGWMAIKAIWNVVTAHLGFKSLSFKVTKKTKVGGDAGGSRRDSSHKDIYFHIVMSCILGFAVVYAAYVVTTQTAFLPDVQALHDPGTGTTMRIICIATGIQILLAYLFPIMYAVLPESRRIHAAVLKGMFRIEAVCVIVAGVMITGFQTFQRYFASKGL
eukprot:TRINITY_DN3009_c0_g1_i1.p1 TRINITY_DN3009_c0_g1~~TRINITY_DN3009_c0_g1_i1.p1  ORF type:complete len:681 (-),score=165.03 TRINITY_DN3009_c0_g1_i1:68-2110(-)